MDSKRVAKASPGTDSEGVAKSQTWHNHQRSLAHWGTAGEGNEEPESALAPEQEIEPEPVQQPELGQ